MDFIAEKILAGEPLNDIRFVDIHAHTFDTGYHGWYTKNTDPDFAYIETMDRIGVDEIIVSSSMALGSERVRGNELTKELIEKYPDRIKGYITVNGNFPEELEQEIEKYKDTPGFVGVKFYTALGMCSLDNPNLDKVYELVSKYNMMLLVHTWGSDGYPCAPNKFRRNLEKHPELKLVVGHAGGDWYGHQETVALMRDYPNVHWDVTGTEFGHMWMEDIVAAVDPKRIVYGSDIGGMDNRHYVGTVGLANIDVEVKLDILGRNADRLLNSLAHL